MQKKKHVRLSTADSINTIKYKNTTTEKILKFYELSVLIATQIIFKSTQINVTTEHVCC